jgi:hypothetical protein
MQGDSATDFAGESLFFALGRIKKDSKMIV